MPRFDTQELQEENAERIADMMWEQRHRDTWNPYAVRDQAVYVDLENDDDVNAVRTPE